MRYALPLLVLLTACGDDPFFVDGAERYDAIPQYTQWWNAARDCVGEPTADLTRVTWWRVDSFGPDFPQTLGAWVAPHDIYILLGHHTDSATVSHEMIHDLLQHGDEAHAHRCF